MHYQQISFWLHITFYTSDIKHTLYVINTRNVVSGQDVCSWLVTVTWSPYLGIYTPFHVYMYVYVLPLYSGHNSWVRRLCHLLLCAPWRHVRWWMTVVWPPITWHSYVHCPWLHADSVAVGRDHVCVCQAFSVHSLSKIQRILLVLLLQTCAREGGGGGVTSIIGMGWYRSVAVSVMAW